jgi:hypothetical protein
MAPLGCPVVPDVYPIVQSAPGSGAISGGEASEAIRSANAKPPKGGSSKLKT